MTQKIATMLATLCCASLAGLSGCASTSPDHDARFGLASKRLAEQQRINPQASQQNEDKPLGADGRIAHAGTERLLSTYREPAKVDAQSIGTVGTSGGIGR